jgi:hypothetical protein
MADETAPDQLTTAPVDRPGAAVRRAIAAPNPDAAKGVATDYLIELVEYPANSGRGLWLKVDESWRRLDNPSSEIQASVHAAFCRPEPLKVVVLYRNDVIVGLAVRYIKASKGGSSKEGKKSEVTSK